MTNPSLKGILMKLIDSTLMSFGVPKVILTSQASKATWKEMRGSFSSLKKVDGIFIPESCSCLCVEKRLKKNWRKIQLLEKYTNFFLLYENSGHVYMNWEERFYLRLYCHVVPWAVDARTNKNKPLIWTIFFSFKPLL